MMPPAKNPPPDRPCAVCGETMTPQNVRNTTCSPGCQAERKRRAAAAWHEANAERHNKACAEARRRRKAK